MYLGFGSSNSNLGDLMDSSMEEILDHAVKKEKRLTTIELTLETHDKTIQKIDKALDSMTNWFRGMVFSIFAGIGTAVILAFLLKPH